MFLLLGKGLFTGTK